MPVKYFCDICGIEVSDPSFSLDMTNKILCDIHFSEYEEKSRDNKWVYKKSSIDFRERWKELPKRLREIHKA